jgi:hypothetical protein
MAVLGPGIIVKIRYKSEACATKDGSEDVLLLLLVAIITPPHF